MKHIILFITLIVLLTNQASATNYYISPDGDDEHNGSINHPWKTFTNINSHYGSCPPPNPVILQPGDTVYLREGIHDNVLQQDTDNGCGTGSRHIADMGQFNPPKGSLENPITITTYPGETAIIDGKNEARGIFLYLAEHVIVTDLIIRNTYGAGIKAIGEHIRIENNYIHNADGPAGSNIGGIDFSHCTYCVARNNKIHTVKVNGVYSQNGAAIGNNYHMEYALIENNELYDAYNGIFHKRSSGNKGAIIRNNLIHNTTLGIRYSIGGTGDPAHVEQEVYNNIFTDVRTGISITTRTTNPESTGIIIRNNVFHTRSGVSINGFRNVTITNNIFYEQPNGYGSSAISLVHDPYRNRGLDSDYNLYYPEASFWEDVYEPTQTHHSTLEAWQTTGNDTNSLQTNPLFIHVEERDYHLQSDSPARGAGIDGNDIGAYPEGNEVIGLLTDPAPSSNPHTPQPTIIQTTDQSVTLQWVEVDNGAGIPANYEVRIAPNTIVWEEAATSIRSGDCVNKTGTNIGSTTSCTINGLTPNATYSIIVASASTTNTNLSNPISATTQTASWQGANADTNNDGTINLSDLLLVAANMGKQSNYDIRADRNADGNVNVQDALLIIEHYASTKE